MIKDTREQKGWLFEETDNCNGTIIQGLKTGDYTLCGLEDVLSIERKGTTGEFVKNINEHRFEQELKRLEGYKHPFIILEFDIEDIMRFPLNSGIPKHLWPKLRISKWYILKRMMELQVNYKTKMILAGKYGRETAASIFKRMAELYAPKEEDGKDK